MSYTQYFVANFGPAKTGLGSITAQLYTSATPPVTSGAAIATGSISELGTGSGVYGALVTVPDAFSGSIRWLPGDGSEAISEEVVDVASTVTTAVWALAGRSLPAAERNAIADAILTRLFTDIDAPMTNTGYNALNALRFLRNVWSTVDVPGFLRVYGENGTTLIWSRSLTTDAAAEPITGAGT
jgi:hypothetical protein